MPERIQRQRTRGWKMPPNTVYVGRPTKWGNPWHVKKSHSRCFTTRIIEGADAIGAVDRYREFMVANPRGLDVTELRGKNLACWCPLGAPCHADVLLRLANGESAA